MPGALSDTAIRPSVCPSPRRAAALFYRHAGCLQFSDVRTADSSADGRRSAASRTAIGGGIPSRGAITCSIMISDVTSPYRPDVPHPPASVYQLPVDQWVCRLAALLVTIAPQRAVLHARCCDTAATSYGPLSVSVCLPVSVCHKSVFYQKG